MYADLIDVQMSTEGGDLLCALVAECEREKLRLRFRRHMRISAPPGASALTGEDQSISLSVLAAPPTLLPARWAYLREQFYL